MAKRPDELAGRIRVAGTISSAAFAGGHRFVIGNWPESPIGSISDVMWTRPDGERVLLTGSDDAADFIKSIYCFDRVVVGPLSVESDGKRTTARSPGLSVELQGGRRVPIMARRPLSVTRYLEAPIARALMGVETYGVSPTGAREWYQARYLRWVVAGGACLDGIHIGSPRPFAEPVSVGFSEPPRRPSIVAVAVTIELP